MNNMPIGSALRMRDVRNAGTEHVFLGDPRSDGCDKTTVEPGNVFSPGVWTCGVSAFVIAADACWCAEETPPEDIDWRFADLDGFSPEICSRWPAGDAEVSCRLTHIGGEGTVGVDFAEYVLAPQASGTHLGLCIRDVGPAGGRIDALDWDAERAALTVNGAIEILFETDVATCRLLEADDSHDSPCALVFATPPENGSPGTLRCRASHNGLGRSFGDVSPRPHTHDALAVGEAFTVQADRWSEQVPAQIFAPDPRISRAWNACAYHILAAMECRLPRIGAVNYPVFWIRDCVIAMRAMDLLGRHDLTRVGCDYLAPLYFAGGFGAESDSPGEGIWALTAHAHMTGDTDWLRSVFPHIRHRVDLIRQMRTTDRPLRALTENRHAATLNTPGSTIMCLPSDDGLIHGKMDWHSPDFYVNCWARAGLAFAARAAALLDEQALADAWQEECADLERRMADRLLPTYGNPRDPIAAPYPTGALADNRNQLRDRFVEWFTANRLDTDGNRSPEPLWTYFEAAQIHNALLLDRKDLAWTCLEGMLQQPPNRDVYAFIEGSPSGAGSGSGGEVLPFRNDLGARGWLSPVAARGGNMPHNWTSAEMANLLRDLFVTERDGHLVLGLGVPDSWCRPGCSFGVRDMPTELGTVSYTVRFGDAGDMALTYDGPGNPAIAVGTPPGTR